MKKSIIVIIFFLFLISSGVYIHYIFSPEQNFINKITEFENACRKADKSKLYTLVSKKSSLFEHIENVNEIKVQFEKFEMESEVINISFIPGYANEIDSLDMIFGAIKKKAKIDGDYRYFLDITLVKENNKWVIQQYFFPDFLDY